MEFLWFQNLVHIKATLERDKIKGKKEGKGFSEINKYIAFGSDGRINEVTIRFTQC